jgi:FAD/FMN-containing dehydrogenase/Fe-S oxidoreductase
LIIDVKRRMNALHMLDVDARTARVGPGIVTAQLNEQLAEHGLFWPPSTSTVNRATVGGMISTDAAGKGSLLYGRTSGHVVALEVVLDDGTVWEAAPVTVAEAERLASGTDRIGEIWRALLDIPPGPHPLPELARGFSGYGIDRVRSEGMVDPIPVLCGSEGTLGVITAATLKLTDVPAHNVLVLATYASFDDALTDSLRLTASHPAAIETFDETTLNRGRASTAWPLLETIVDSDAGSMLLLEYTGATEPDVVAVEDLITRGSLSRSVTVVRDQAVKAAAWKVRADAVGLLAKVAPGEPRPTAFVEDCAVPVAEMPAFIRGFRALLDARGLTYAMFGHADVGCVHVRPALDPIDESHERLVADVTADAKHGGILWGEHGRGVRGQFADDFLEPGTVLIMRRLKAAFDPLDCFNPGKLYRPISSHEPLLTIDEVPTRAASDRRVPLEVRSEFASAFSCNGNGLCHHYSTSEVMCPSFKATGDPMQAPKGRADLIRQWLVTEEQNEPNNELTEAVATTMHQCLSCAACTGRCPVQVDIPELKSRFFERYYQQRKRPLAHRVLSRFEQVAGLAAFPPTQLAELGARIAGSRLGLVDLPVPSRRSLRARPVVANFDPATPTDIVILPDVFTSVFEPQTFNNAVITLESLGYTVSRSAFVPSGKFDHVKGDRVRFAKAAAAQRELLEPIAASGSIPVVVDPAVALMFRREYPAIHPGFPAQLVQGLVEVLAARVDRIPRTTSGKVELFGHCTERSLAPEWIQQWESVLTAAGCDVEVVETTCCGMAGVFGHEVKNQQVSRHLFERGWRQRLDDAHAPVATGWSCRSQAKRLGGGTLSHPLDLLG